jgi:glycine/D-amino acid oxidase-like deaminating enzyme
VAVIGGGYTGMAAALRLAERGADVVLVEAEFWGAERVRATPATSPPPLPAKP